MNLKDRIKAKDITFGVIGLGYVGLPLAVEFARAGFKVVGIDVDENKVDKINRGVNYIKDVEDALFKQVVSQGSLTATADFKAIREIDAVSICVPTPLSKLKDPDVSYIMSALDGLVEYFHKDMLVVLESTTYPGTTRELLLPKLEESELTVGEDFFLAFSPERVDPGNEVYTTKNTPKVMGGITPQCTEMGKLLYEQVIDTIIPVSTPEAAEMVKLLENTFRAINIGLVNEMAIMAEKLGVNIWEVIDAAGTKPFGFMKFYPGPGLGGHCIPIDPHYLSWKMKTLDYKARFIELASEVNTKMPEHVVNLVMEGLNRFHKSVNGAIILVLGVAYKKDIDDVRESPALDVIKLLEQYGAEVDYYDPYVNSLQLDGKQLRSVDNIEERYKEYDCCVITTDHSGVDYDLLTQRNQVIIDTRNVTNQDKVIKIGDKNGKSTKQNMNGKPDLKSHSGLLQK